MRPANDPRLENMSRWRLILTELGLVSFSGATALAGLLGLLGCLNEGQLTRPAVCESRTVESWYAVGLAVGAAIAVVGVVAGHFKRRWLIVIGATCLSLVVLIAIIVWGMHAVAVPPQ